MAEDRRRRLPPLAGDCGEDRISCLPDGILHVILLGLGSSRAAARTSVLSRRWRLVWAHLPELFLCGSKVPSSKFSFADAVDAALAAYAAPTLENLGILVPKPGPGPEIPAHRVARWLRFASQRVTGSIYINMSPNLKSFFSEVPDEEVELERPSCGATATISLSLGGSWKLRLAGEFAALTKLEIHFTRMDGSELSDLVSRQCPRLKILSLLVTLVAVSDVSIHSDSLQSLRFYVCNTRRLEVVAPGLEDLWYQITEEAHISAPKLARVAWHDAYDPHRHQFTGVCRYLRLLRIRLEPIVTLLMKQFDEVDELSLLISIPPGIAGYHSFLNETNKLSKCDTLTISLAWNQHGLAPAILHIFRCCCASIRKLSTEIKKYSCGPTLRYSCPLACPCRLVESCNVDNIALSSLEEVEINSFVGSHEEMEFVEQLWRCNAAVLKKLVINCTADSSPQTKELCGKVRSMCRANVKVEFYVLSNRRRLRLD